MIIRVRYKQLGGHVHCRVFTAIGPDRTFAKCGELTFSNDEWEGVIRIWSDQDCQFVEDAHDHR